MYFIIWILFSYCKNSIGFVNGIVNYTCVSNPTNYRSSVGSHDKPIGDVNGDGGLNVLILGGAGGGGGAGKGAVTDPHGNGGNGGGDGIPESSGVSGDPFGGEISAKSPSLTGDVMSI